MKSGLSLQGGVAPESTNVRRNARTAAILLSIAAVFFIGIVLRHTVFR